MTPDWIPQNHIALYDLSGCAWHYLQVPGNRNRLGFVAGTPQGIWLDTEFTAAFNSYRAAYDAWFDPVTRTRDRTLGLKVAEKNFKAMFRKLYRGFLKNSPLVTDLDLLDMGLPIRPGGRKKSHPAPETFIASSVILIGPAVLDIAFHDRGGKSAAKPHGVRGAEMASCFSDTPVTNHEELTDMKFTTRTPFHLSFHDSRRGKTLYFSLRWQGTLGEKGPWNDIRNVIIP
jgi:hypothetical protein